MRLNLGQITNISAGIVILAWESLNKLFWNDPDMFIVHLGSLVLSIGATELVRGNWQPHPVKGSSYVKESFFWAESPVTRNTIPRGRGVIFFWVAFTAFSLFAYFLVNIVCLAMALIFFFTGALYTATWLDAT
jgi:hypothetical protein